MPGLRSTQEVKYKKGGSTKIGLDFVKEIRLSEKSYIAQNGPTTTHGVMTDGDYQFLAAKENDFYAIYTKSFDNSFHPHRILHRSCAITQQSCLMITAVQHRS